MWGPPRLGLVALVALVGILPPALAANREILILQTDVDELQRQVLDLKRIMELQSQNIDRLVALVGSGPDARSELVAFNANVDALRREILRLGERFDATAERLQSLERRLDRPAQLAPGGNAAAGTPNGASDGVTSAAGTETGTSARSLYSQAYADYVADSFDLAISEFRDFLTRFPHDEQVNDAQYWLAMSYFNQGAYEEAVRELDVFLQRSPDASNAPAALYKKGMALAELNRLGQAVLVLNDVVRRYPRSPAAAQAQSRLRELASGGEQ